MNMFHNVILMNYKYRTLFSECGSRWNNGDTFAVFEMPDHDRTLFILRYGIEGYRNGYVKYPS